MDLENVTYLDNNATTLMPEVVKKEMINWFNKGNPSAIYSELVGATQLIEKFKLKVSAICEFDPAEYTTIITSGASEANNFILKSTVKSYLNYKQRQPHVIISAIEHKSLLECAKEMKKNNQIELTIIKPNQLGCITWDAVRPFIQSNTCIVCVMFANNETGVLNEVNSIGAHLAKKNIGIPFYVDCTQSFGKIPVRPSRRGITAFTGSFHKIGGPASIGVLVCLNSLISGYKLCAEICGSQNNGLRGGTENLFMIAGSFIAMKEAYTGRERKNNELLAMQLFVIKNLMQKIPTSFFENWKPENIQQVSGILNYRDSNLPPRVEMVVIGSNELAPERRALYMLPNTIMLAFIKHNQDTQGGQETFVEGGGDVGLNVRPICNFKMAETLMKANVVVGLGSACNRGEPSYVLEAMGVPKQVANSTIRISFGDSNSDVDARTVVREILLALRQFV